MAPVMTFVLAIIVSVICGGFLGGIAGIVLGINPDITAALAILASFALISSPLWRGW